MFRKGVEGGDAFLSVPSSALLDLGNVQLQQVVDPSKQFLSTVERPQSAREYNHDKSHVFLDQSHLDSPILSVVSVVVVG